ncbi:MAG: hypothetical protein C5B49_12450 [Bdellovibrio sp.]|nr:MAG: hypothetical protein C5B49_12450 [Bdellovibrio sp.]
MRFTSAPKTPEIALKKGGGFVLSKHYFWSRGNHQNRHPKSLGFSWQFLHRFGHTAFNARWMAVVDTPASLAISRIE